MNYRSALDYVLSFSDYERYPGAGYAERWDLRRMEGLLERLGTPHLKRRTVHIAGSKGKGSTAAMIASGLEAAGFKTGLYTSPHLHTMRERIKVNNRLTTEDEFAQMVTRIKPTITEQNEGPYGELSTFEILTALAFSYFEQKSCDFQVLETGLGGQLDATNVVPHPDVCVLTSISLDHTAVLGNTLAQIATEKAGIIKPGCTVISSPQSLEAATVIRSVSEEKGARLVTVGQEITWRKTDAGLNEQSLKVKGIQGEYALQIPLMGEHQLENAAIAVGALEALGIDSEAIRQGLQKVSWPGRMQVLSQHPLLIADGAHNGDSTTKLVRSIKDYFTYDKSILIIGTSADKNSAAIIAELAPFFDVVITTISEHPRATDAKELASQFKEFGIEAVITKTVSQALEEARNRASARDLICATGSLFLVAEVIENVKGISGERYPD